MDQTQTGVLRRTPHPCVIGPTLSMPRTLHALGLTAMLGAACTPALRDIDFPPAPLPVTTAKSASRSWRRELDVHGGAPESAVRFVLVGDSGVRPGDAKDKVGAPALHVARSATTACTALGGCDFGVFLGDNVYESGVNNPTDEAFLANFSEAWAFVGPQYFVAGNHDYGSVTGPLRPANNKRLERQFEWIDRHETRLHTRGGAHFFNFTAGPVELWALDSNYLVHKCRARTRSGFRCRGSGIEAVLDDVGRGEARWKIVLTHHPQRSNGSHGNAGRFLDGGLRLWPGRGYAAVLEGRVIGRSHLLASGHDHNLQFFAPEVGSESPRAAQLVSGAGGKTKRRSAKARNKAAFEVYGVLGFAVVDASMRALVVRIYSVDLGDQGSAAVAAYTTCLVGSDPVWREGDACNGAALLEPTVPPKTSHGGQQLKDSWRGPRNSGVEVTGNGELATVSDRRGGCL